MFPSLQWGFIVREIDAILANRKESAPTERDKKKARELE